MCINFCRLAARNFVMEFWRLCLRTQAGVCWRTRMVGEQVELAPVFLIWDIISNRSPINGAHLSSFGTICCGMAGFWLLTGRFWALVNAAACCWRAPPSPFGQFARKHAGWPTAGGHFVGRTVLEEMQRSCNLCRAAAGKSVSRLAKENRYFCWMNRRY